MIRIAIAGYGNIGRGVEFAVEQHADMELVAIFTRRPVSSLKPRTDTPVAALDSAYLWTDKVDVLILCGGSSGDLPEQGPLLAQWFHTVDSFDIHTDIPQYFAKMDAVLRTSGKLGLLAAGWDPGLFSLNRLILSAILPEGRSDTFWGKGVSQGHSNAIRRVEGVLDAVQYTCPLESAAEQVRKGEHTVLSAAQKHTRECFVVLKEGADAEKVEREICNMPYYFADYSTAVHFISAQELHEKHSNMPGGGFVYGSGKTGEGNRQSMEFSLRLESNPEFTSHVLTAYAGAVFRMQAEGKTGAVTVLDVPPALLSQKSAEQLRLEML